MQVLSDFLHNSAVGAVVKEALFLGLSAVISSLVVSSQSDPNLFGTYTGGVYLLLQFVRQILAGVKVI